MSEPLQDNFLSPSASIPHTISRSKQNSKLLWIVGGIVLLGIVGTASFFLGTHFQKKESLSVVKDNTLSPTIRTITPTILQISDDIKDWITYTNTVAGSYSFKYPSTWEQKPTTEGCGPVFANKGKFTSWVTICGVNLTGDLNKIVEERTSHLITEKLISRKDLMINGHKIVELEINQTNVLNSLEVDIDKVNGIFYTQDLKSTENKVGVLQVYFYAHDPVELKEKKELFEKMLSTFQFSTLQVKKNIFIVLKANPSDKNKGDVFVKDLDTNQETFYMTIDNLDYGRGTGEYRNGNIYIVKRTGEDYPGTNWTNELWKYDSNKNGKKLFEHKGVAFTVSAEDKYITVSYRTQDTAEGDMLLLLDSNGATLKTYLPNTSTNSFNTLGINDDQNNPTLFLEEVQGQTIVRITTVHLKDFSSSVVDTTSVFSMLSILSYATFNPTKSLLVFDTCPHFFTVGEPEAWAKRNVAVTLYSFNVTTGEKEIISTTKAACFQPHWKDASTLEYMNEGKKIQKKF